MRTQPSSKAWRRNMRNMYRRAFAYYDAYGMPTGYKTAVRRMMRRGRKMPMFNPADLPAVFGTNPETWPKNKYQWRQQLGSRLIPYPKIVRKDNQAIVGK